MVKTTRPFSAVLGDFKRLDEKEHRVRSFYEPISEQERLAWSLGRTHGLATRHHRYADSLAWTDDASHLLTVDIPAPDRPQAVAALTARGKAGKMAAVQRSMQHLALGQAGDASPGEGLTPRGQPWQAVVQPAGQQLQGQRSQQQQQQQARQPAPRPGSAPPRPALPAPSSSHTTQAAGAPQTLSHPPSTPGLATALTEALDSLLARPLPSPTSPDLPASTLLSQYAASQAASAAQLAAAACSIATSTASLRPAARAQLLAQVEADEAAAAVQRGAAATAAAAAMAQQRMAARAARGGLPGSVGFPQFDPPGPAADGQGELDPRQTPSPPHLGREGEGGGRGGWVERLHRGEGPDGARASRQVVSRSQVLGPGSSSRAGGAGQLRRSAAQLLGGCSLQVPVQARGHPSLTAGAAVMSRSQEDALLAQAAQAAAQAASTPSLGQPGAAAAEGRASRVGHPPPLQRAAQPPLSPQAQLLFWGHVKLPASTRPASAQLPASYRPAASQGESSRKQVAAGGPGRAAAAAGQIVRVGSALRQRPAALLPAHLRPHSASAGVGLQLVGGPVAVPPLPNAQPATPHPPLPSGSSPWSSTGSGHQAGGGRGATCSVGTAAGVGGGAGAPCSAAALPRPSSCPSNGLRVRDPGGPTVSTPKGARQQAAAAALARYQKDLGWKGGQQQGRQSPGAGSSWRVADGAVALLQGQQQLGSCNEVSEQGAGGEGGQQQQGAGAAGGGRGTHQAHVELSRIEDDEGEGEEEVEEVDVSPLDLEQEEEEEEGGRGEGEEAGGGEGEGAGGVTGAVGPAQPSSSGVRGVELATPWPAPALARSSLPAGVLEPPAAAVPRTASLPLAASTPGAVQPGASAYRLGASGLRASTARGPAWPGQHSARGSRQPGGAAGSADTDQGVGVVTGLQGGGQGAPGCRAAADPPALPTPPDGPKARMAQPVAPPPPLDLDLAPGAAPPAAPASVAATLATAPTRPQPAAAPSSRQLSPPAASQTAHPPHLPPAAAVLPSAPSMAARRASALAAARQEVWGPPQAPWEGPRLAASSAVGAGLGDSGTSTSTISTAPQGLQQTAGDSSKGVAGEAAGSAQLGEAGQGILAAVWAEVGSRQGLPQHLNTRYHEGGDVLDIHPSLPLAAAEASRHNPSHYPLPSPSLTSDTKTASNAFDLQASLDVQILMSVGSANRTAQQHPDSALLPGWRFSVYLSDLGKQGARCGLRTRVAALTTADQEGRLLVTDQAGELTCVINAVDHLPWVSHPSQLQEHWVRLEAYSISPVAQKCVDSVLFLGPEHARGEPPNPSAMDIIEYRPRRQSSGKREVNGRKIHLCRSTEVTLAQVVQARCLQDAVQAAPDSTAAVLASAGLSAQISAAIRRRLTSRLSAHDEHHPVVNGGGSQVLAPYELAGTKSVRSASAGRARVGHGAAAARGDSRPVSASGHSARTLSVRDISALRASGIQICA